MSQILNKVRDVDPNNSDAVKEVLSTFFSNLSKHTDLDCNRWLRALENIINRFPKYCGSHRNTIETYLCHFIDCNNYYNVIEAAKCAHALQQVRPLNEKTATSKICWREHLTVLCGAAHKLLGAIFPNSIDIYQGSNKSQKLQLQSSTSSPLGTAMAQILSVPKTQNNNSNKQVILTTRLRNILVFVQATLVEIYPVAKPIQPQLVIEIIVRALSISSGANQAQDITKAVCVKMQALRTLDALVACLGPNLVPFSSLIFKFVILTLKWCTENANEETSEVRRSAYETLRRWLSALHSHRPADSPRGRAWEDSLTEHIVADITPARHVVQLTMNSQPTKHLSKKAKRKLANSMLQESSIAAHSPGEKNKVPMSQESNDEIAVTALDCAETFLNVCGVFLKPTTHKLFQERVVRECFNIDAYSDTRALGLVRVLDALRRSSPRDAPPPTQYALQIYTQLINSRVHEVSKFCTQALLDIRLHLHCSPPSLSFAMEVQATHKPAEKAKKMSSRNRAALESLLGVEKVPNNPEDIIDIADEPSKKKPRIESDTEEVSDKISVSSESSVEISDESDDDIQEVTEIIDVVDGGQISSLKTQLPSRLKEDTEDTQETQHTSEATVEEESSESGSKVDSTDQTSKEESQESTAESSKASKDKESDETSETGDTTSQEEGSDKGIHEMKTQLPINASAESAEELRSPRSMEVEIAYDFPNTNETRVTILERTEDDNLPSTNDTDDVHITCGQVFKGSQEVDNERESTKIKEKENKENEVPKINGDSVIEKPDITDKINELTVTEKNKDVTVEDMLADFVDEIIE